MAERLDRILIEQGAISESALRAALLRQKACGGRFGSHLVYYRHISEEQLVNALAAQLDCPGVVISKADIPESTINLIPKKVALTRCVIPFEYDEISRTLHVACLNPADPELAKELAFVAHGKQIELHVAAEIALSNAIARYYLGQEASLDESLLIEIPEDATRPDERKAEPGLDDIPSSDTLGMRMLLVTDEEYAPPLVQSILERHGHAVQVSASIEDVTDRVDKERFDRVCIKHSLATDRVELDARIRKISPGTTICFYRDMSELILGGSDTQNSSFFGNLKVLTSLLSNQAKLSGNHAAHVATYVDNLCRRMRLPQGDRLLITDAAYLHDIAKYYDDTDPDSDNREIIEHSIRLLNSLDYPSAVVETLRSMFVDLDGCTESRLSIEVLGGNILTAVDLVCHSVSGNGRLSLDRLDVVKKKWRDLVGRMLLSEVVEPLIEMLQEETLVGWPNGKEFQIMLFAGEDTCAQTLALRLKNEGFRVVSENSASALHELYERRRPDMLLLALQGPPGAARAQIEELSRGGLRLEETPVLVVFDRASSAEVADLLETGIEDVVICNEGYGLLVRKIRKIVARTSAEAQTADKQVGVSAGASGRLVDMNLVDLIQALGPGCKTVRLTLRNNGDSADVMTMYLREGKVVFAELGGLAGPEAIYESLSWSTGSWSVEPVTPEDIPPPNTEESNESILMEGCRLLDERIKAGHLL